VAAEVGTWKCSREKGRGLKALKTQTLEVGFIDATRGIWHFQLAAEFPGF